MTRNCRDAVIADETGGSVQSISFHGSFCPRYSISIAPSCHSQTTLCLAPVRTSGFAPALETTDGHIAPPNRCPGPAPSAAGSLPATLPLPRSVSADENTPPPRPPAGTARCAPGRWSCCKYWFARDDLHPELLAHLPKLRHRFFSRNCSPRRGCARAVIPLHAPFSLRRSRG